MLYTNKDGTEVVCTFKTYHEGSFCLYQVVFPIFKKTLRLISNTNFKAAYPIKVDGVKIEEGAEKAYGIIAGYLYTDGTTVVGVAQAREGRVRFWEIHPRTRSNYELDGEKFLENFSWEIDAVELEK